MACSAQGVSGAVTKPIQGARSGGLDGFFKGVAQGAVGLLVKPVVGVADGITSATAGLKTTTTIGHPGPACRQRLPRTFGSLGEMRAFSSEDAAIQHALSEAIKTEGGRIRALAVGRYFGHVVCDSPNGSAIIFIAMTSHVVLASFVISTDSKECDRTRNDFHEISGVQRDKQGPPIYDRGSLFWWEPLANVGAWESLEHSLELILHLRNGGVRRLRFSSAQSRQQGASLVEEAVGVFAAHRR
eukprot:scaffold277595_cov31-Tisochrysis_lutea.AAC.2